MDYEGVSCKVCRETSIKEKVEPACINGMCPTSFDLLPDSALRMLEIRGLLISLNELNLAGQICEEFGVDLDDLKMLAEIETLLKELHPPKGQDNG